MAQSNTVYVTGEPELMEEFGALLVRAGARVAGRPQPGAARGALPAGIKKSAAVPRTAAVGIELTNANHALKKKNLQFLDAGLPKGAILLSSSVTVAAHEQASWIKHPERLVGISALPTLVGRPLMELAPCVQTDAETLRSTAAFFAGLKKEIAVIQDRVGMVAPRVVCAVINEACFAVGENIATAADIDTAMKLGTSYPRGPIEWGNAIGFHQVAAVLDALQRDLGDDRYRIAPVLRHLASGRRWWGT